MTFNQYPRFISEVFLEDYKVYMPALENKRSVHSKLVEYMIENILSKDCVFLLIDILFNDMKEDYKLIEGSSTSELEDDDEEIEGL